MLDPKYNLDLKTWACFKANELFEQSGLKANFSPNQFTRSKLRSDTLLAAQPSYQDISFVQGKANANASEILIKQNDAFLAFGVGLSTKKLTAAATDALHVKAQNYNYPNTYVFDGSNEVTTIFALWNARLSFQQNQSVPYPLIWTGDLLRATDQVYGDQTGLITGPVYSRKIVDGKPNSEYPFFGIEPILLLGTDQTYANLNLGAAQDITESAEFNYFTIILDGFRISGK